MPRIRLLFLLLAAAAAAAIARAGGGPEERLEAARVQWTLAPDGRRLAVWAFVRHQPSATAKPTTNAVVQVWDLRRQHLEATLRGHTGPVTAVAFSRDGKLLASGGADGDVRIWKASSWTCADTLPAEPGQVNVLAFSPDGRLLAAGSGTTFDPTRIAAPLIGAVHVWRVSGRRLLSTFCNDAGPVLRLAFSPDGALIASRNSDTLPYTHQAPMGDLRLWDAATGKLERALAAGTEGYAHTLVFSPDGKNLAAAPHGSRPSDDLRVWDLTTAGGPRLLPAARHYPEAVAFSPDSRLVAAMANGWGAGNMPEDVITVWNVASGARLHTFAPNGALLRAVAFSTDGRLVAGRQAVEAIVRQPLPQPAGGADRFYDQKGPFPGRALLWDVAAGRPASLSAEEIRARFPAEFAQPLSADGARIRLHDPLTGRVEAALETHL